MNKDHSRLICDIGELTTLFTDTANLDVFLQKIVEMIATHMNADVCSIYLYSEETEELVLKATRGLRADSVGKVRLKLGEGLTGKALLEYRPVCEGDARSHPGFRLFTGIGEEGFSSFLAVPIMRGQTRIGAMTLQSVRKNYFTPEHITVFRAISSQLANTIEMTKLLINIKVPEHIPVPAVKVSGPRFIKGRSGAEGIAFGEAVVIAPLSLDDIVACTPGKEYTLEDLRAAIAATERQLEGLQKEIETRLFDVASLIFSAHILMLKDQTMIGAMESLVARGMAPEQAVRTVIMEYVGRFERMSNAFLREKKYDVIDVGRRVLENLLGACSVVAQYTGKIVFARELLPSDALKLSTQGALGIVLLSGGVTSHVAVLARSLNFPLIIAEDTDLLSLPAGTKVLLDGDQGNIYIAPDQEVRARFADKEESRRAAAQVRDQVSAETRMADGTLVQLLANINLLGDLAVAKDFKARGVGLYRTEFPFMVRNDFPTEEEQYVIYRKLVESMRGYPVTFRTLDIGGDKVLSYYDYEKEANPFLGLRSIRFSLKHKDIFAQQIRAILRAGHISPVKLMFPMISSLDEFRLARAMVYECQEQLAKAGIAHQQETEIGLMIELPAAVALAGPLAREAAFFSIGTNDLIQYTLAVDRTNEKVADLYVPHHPSVLQALATVVNAALRHGKDVSICGDMAHDPRYVPFLLGIGVRTFSLDARYIPRVQATVRGLDEKAVVAAAQHLLALETVQDIEAALPREISGAC
jgi:phosphotransferase system enzyme I (PtsP)